jgi:hypothetical protein
MEMQQPAFSTIHECTVLFLTNDQYATLFIAQSGHITYTTF